MRNPPKKRRSGTTAVTLLPVEPAWRLAERAPGAALARHRPLVTRGGRHRRRRAQVLQVVPGSGPRGRRCCRCPLPAPLCRARRRPRPPVCRRGRPGNRAPAARGHRRRCRCGACRSRYPGHHRPDAASRSRGRELAQPGRDRCQAAEPRLLILDPFVRLHRIDENASGEVAPLLAYLRELQRRHGLAVLVVHHAKGAGRARAGQALRGSSSSTPGETAISTCAARAILSPSPSSIVPPPHRSR